jgi:tetratricopeptide (TPR) repeat protein
MDIDEFLETESGDEGKPGRKELVEKQSAEFISDASLDSQLAKIRELMNAKKYKDAEKVYFAVKEQYSLLARRQEEARKRLHRELMAINKELLEHLNAAKIDMDQKALIINDLLAKARQYMQQGNTDKANQLYIEVREIFKNIPDAFAEQKMLMENQILMFYSQLTNESNKKNYGKLLEKRDEIVRHIEIAMNDVHLNNIDHAKKEYQTVNTLYNELPEGFLYEKTLIYKRILALYQLIEEGTYIEKEIEKPAPVQLVSSLQIEQKKPKMEQKPIIQEKPAQKISQMQQKAAAEKKSFFGFMKKEQRTEQKIQPVAVQEKKRVMDAPPLPL